MTIILLAFELPWSGQGWLDLTLLLKSLLLLRLWYCTLLHFFFFFFRVGTLLTSILQKAERNVSGASSQTQALEAAIEAAEHYMKALKLASVPKDKQALDAKCKEWLTRAEKIKGVRNWQSATLGGSNDRLGPPVPTRKLTTREEIILLEGAKLNGFIFPPWVNAPKPEYFQREGGELFL